MATAQAVRTKGKNVTWSNIFPTEQVTEQQSALFVKKLLAVAVSSITYLRTIFPEHAFGDRCLEDLNLKILKDDSACSGASQVIQWIKGCFDALDKKYLRMIVIGIYVDPADPETVIESYTFKFSYNREGIDIYRNERKVASAYTEAETKKATIRLLRTIILLTQTLKSLPDDVMMTMKLFYFDDVTPADYQPPGFKETSGEAFKFVDDPFNIRVGDVSTSFHTVKLRIKTDCQQLELREDEVEKEEGEEEADEEERSSVSSTPMHVQHESGAGKLKKTQAPEAAMQEESRASGSETTDTRKRPSAGRSSCDEGDPTAPAPPEITLGKRKASGIGGSLQTQSAEFEVMECEDIPDKAANLPGPSDKAATNNSRVAAESKTEEDSDDEGDPKVACCCGCNEDDGLMILCSVCDFWQHAVCYGILEEAEAPQVHVCVECFQKDEGNLQGTDPTLAKLDQVALQATALWRRTLLACSEMNRILPTNLSRRLGVEMSVAQGLLKRLEREGFIRGTLKGKRLGKIVNKAKLHNEGIKEYFYANKQAPVTDALDQEERQNQTEQGEAMKIEDIVSKATELDVSGKLRPRQNTEGKPFVCAEEVDKRRARSGKRALSAADQTTEFEISDSQEPVAETVRSPKRRKASIAARAILV